MNGLTRKLLVMGVVLLFFGVSVLALGCGEKAGEQDQGTQSEAVDGVAEQAGDGGDAVLLVIAPEDFQDQEYETTRSVLEESGYRVRVASATSDTCLGMNGTEVRPDLTLQEVDVGEYVAVAFIGGGGAAVYFDDPAALDIARQAYQRGITVGAICVAPVILAKAGILGGKEATVSPSGVNDLEQAGAEYTGGDVETDGKIITACGPQASEAFGLALADNIAK